jgi:hypothetical protein
MAVENNLSHITFIAIKSRETSYMDWTHALTIATVNNFQ